MSTREAPRKPSPTLAYHRAEDLRAQLQPLNATGKQYPSSRWWASVSRNHLLCLSSRVMCRREPLRASDVALGDVVHHALSADLGKLGGPVSLGRGSVPRADRIAMSVARPCSWTS